MDEAHVEQVAREVAMTLREQVLRDRLHSAIANVSTEHMEGDNLAVTLCDAFCDGGEPDGDSGWSPAATAGYEAAMAAIVDAALAAIIPLIAAHEREECVREAEDYAAWHDKHDDGLSGFDKMAEGAREIAAAIRARGGEGGAG